ncbi:MAG: hypothetical protein WCJ40_17890 [Planctomycetota bacterium]
MTMESIVMLALLFSIPAFLAIVIRWLFSFSRNSLYKFLGALGLIFSFFALGIVIHDELVFREFAHFLVKLREQHPVVSLAERLPARVSKGEVKLSDQSQQRLNQLEQSEEFQKNQVGTNVLEDIHDVNLARFVRQNGLGLGRMNFPMYKRIVSRAFKPLPPVPQPGWSTDESWRPFLMSRHLEKLDPARLESAHTDNIMDFLFTADFGFVQAKKRAAGFMGHQFKQLHEPQNWAVERLELVGLVVADQPRVYRSDNLPSMGELRKASTRPLDFFEAQGLAVLEGGDDLYYREEAGSLRMIGAIRSTSQCLKCHDGQRGELLGAFSYWLR